MRLSTGEFNRRLLIHVLPDGFHRIRHYGLLASAGRKSNIETIRHLIGIDPPAAGALEALFKRLDQAIDAGLPAARRSDPGRDARRGAAPAHEPF